MILKILHALGPRHGFGIARRIEQVIEDVLTLNEGTVYSSLLRVAAARLDRGEIGDSPQGGAVVILVPWKPVAVVSGDQPRAALDGAAIAVAVVH
jgi:Transcriptional regulator PadR-like family